MLRARPINNNSSTNNRGIPHLELHSRIPFKRSRNKRRTTNYTPFHHLALIIGGIVLVFLVIPIGSFLGYFSSLSSSSLVDHHSVTTTEQTHVPRNDDTNSTEPFEFRDNNNNNNATGTSNQNLTQQLQQYKTINDNKTTAYSSNQKLLQLWSGEANRRPFPIPDLSESAASDGSRSSITTKFKTIELVIAYCGANLTWIYEDVLQQIVSTTELDSTVKMTILSKCGNEADLPRFIDDYRVSDVTLIKLPNVGGCDYAYAHFLNIYTSKDTTTTPSDAESSLILFLKDSRRSMESMVGNKASFPLHSRHRSVSEMIDIASRGGGRRFICGAKFQCDVSPFHDTAKLNLFRIGKYVRTTDLKKGSKAEHAVDFNSNRYHTVGDFHRHALNWTFPNRNLTEVCYGGVFAVPASNLVFLSSSSSSRSPNNERRRHDVLKRIEDILGRNVSISIEEHFMERTWAGLLTPPLNDEEVSLIRGLQEKKGSGVSNLKTSVYGALRGNASLTCS